jgi:hypothetical protein
MRWITLSEALDLIGHDQKDALRRALCAGDVKLRKRNEDGTVRSLDPSHVAGAEIDWDGSRLAVIEFQFFVLGGGGAPMPPEFVQVEVDRATLLENFPIREMTQTAIGRKGQPPGLEDWYIERAHRVPYSSRNDDLDAAREVFGQFTKDWEILRELRKEHAPPRWSQPGPKSGTSRFPK